MSISLARMNGIAYANYIKENKNLSVDFESTDPVTTEQAENSFVSVRVYYDALSFKHTTESPKLDVVSLLASIGGTLGLCMGVSILSLCEFIEILIDIYFITKN
jgi:hypothetical protein